MRVGSGIVSSLTSSHVAQAGEFVGIEPLHATMHSCLDALVGIGQLHKQAQDACTLRRAVGWQFIGTGSSRLECLVIVLLAPDGRLAFHANLCIEDTVDAFVERSAKPCFHLVVDKIAAVDVASLEEVTEEGERIHHRVIIISDMHLIATIVGPELWPTSILVLSAEQVFHATTETFLITLFACLLVETCQIFHLHRGGSVVDGRIVVTLLIACYSDTFLGSEVACHIDILGPTARDTLIEQHLVANASSLVGLEECIIGGTHRITRLSNKVHGQ